jgi:hypothetical protein
MNPQLWGWFDNGEIVEAILGTGEYFISDHLWGKHDDILVFHQLLEWANERDAWPNAFASVETALEVAAQTGAGSQALDVANCAVIVGDNVDANFLTDKAISTILGLVDRTWSDPHSQSTAEKLAERYKRPPGWYHKSTGIWDSGRSDWLQVRWWNGREWSTEER